MNKDICVRCGEGVVNIRVGAIIIKDNKVLMVKNNRDAMTPEDAYSILEAIAEINNYKHRLKKWKASAEEQKDEEIAQEISEAHQERMAPFTFSMCNIAVGEQIEFWRSNTEPSGIMCAVADDKHVSYNGQKWSLTALAKPLLGVKWAMAGPRYFKYNGEWLNDIRKRLGV